MQYDLTNTLLLKSENLRFFRTVDICKAQKQRRKRDGRTNSVAESQA